MLTATVRLASSGDFFVEHLPRTAPFRVELPDGGTLRMLSGEAVSSVVYWRGWSGHEPESTPLFWRCAQEARVTLDVGAHVGYHAALAGLANPLGWVHAFEPMPHIADRCEANVAMNGLRNVTVHRIALGRRHGADTMFSTQAIEFPSASTFNAGYLRRGGVLELSEHRVEVTTMDEFAADIDHVDFVKIDAETTEDAVVEGAVETFRRHRPVVLCEVFDEAVGDKVARQFDELEYVPYLMDHSGPRRVQRVKPAWPLTNYLFVHDAGPLKAALAAIDARP
jgi:FkbM family methyltransferase